MFRTTGRDASRQPTLERRLFLSLLTALLVPALIILIAAMLAGTRSMRLVGTLGPWNEVAQSGRQLFDAAGPAARRDTVLARAIDQHQRNLSASLTEARRWSFLGSRAAEAMPWLIALVVLVLVAMSLWISRRLARDLAHPIEELAGWASLMGQGAPLPADTTEGSTRREVSEVRSLRSAMREAASTIEAAHSRKLEEERIRAWGEMARRVAHEMKNPLTPLRLAAHRLRSATPNNAELDEPMDVIGEELDRLDALAKHFALLGRPAAGPRSEIDLKELMEDLLRSDVPSTIGTSVTADRDIPSVEGQLDSLQRSMRNLIRNAVEAMTLYATSVSPRARMDRSDPRIDVRLRQEGDGVHMEIEDTGGGMPEDSLQRIFDADFTLKAGGTGLGLAMVRQSIVAHRGTIKARNGEHGAIFDVWLPLG